ncbi:WecB/TagA/CpsF family glycosyltransferase [Clostridium perfringens]|nr:WecB/TagA/CpsF family glycosyltransferase [Clostridium perfringens]MDM0449408.1 WecB/TagA/CpsF family glycosyltransferase [Clostridium perfringens]
MDKCNILGVDIAVTNMDETIKYIEGNLNELKGNYICISNVHTTVTSYEDDEYKKIQNGGALALPDGAPLSYVSRKRGFKEAKRVTGPDLMGEIFKISEKKGYTHFFYGSTPDVIKELKKNLLNKYPNINIKGIYSPPFKNEVTLECKSMIREFNNCDFLWVGLGAPKQERWMSLHKGRVNSIMIGVGAGFDYYANRIKRAPKWMQDNNLEWLYRLLQDPKRLFKRYLITNLKFIKNAIILGR